MANYLSRLLVSTLLLFTTAALSAPTAAPGTFYIVTSTQRQSTSDSTSLRGVSATTYYSPGYQPNYLLRELGPGYGSLPNFTLTSDGALSTYALPPRGFTPTVFESVRQEEGAQLQFLQGDQGAGNIGLWKGYLLTVDGKAKGWTVCDAGGSVGPVVSGHIRGPTNLGRHVWTVLTDTVLL